MTYTGDYGNGRHNGEYWDGITCVKCGAVSSAYLCGDCLEENLITQPEPREEEDWREELFEPKPSLEVKFFRIVLGFALAGMLALVVLALTLV
jgi:hypothetical protein